MLRRGDSFCGWTWGRTGRSLAPQNGGSARGPYETDDVLPIKPLRLGMTYVAFPCGVREAKSRGLCLHGRRRPRPLQGHGECFQSPCSLPRSELGGITAIIIYCRCQPHRYSRGTTYERSGWKDTRFNVGRDFAHGKLLWCRSSESWKREE